MGEWTCCAMRLPLNCSLSCHGWIFYSFGFCFCSRSVPTKMSTSTLNTAWATHTQLPAIAPILSHRPSADWHAFRCNVRAYLFKLICMPHPLQKRCTAVKPYSHWLITESHMAFRFKPLRADYIHLSGHLSFPCRAIIMLRAMFTQEGLPNQGTGPRRMLLGITQAMSETVKSQTTITVWQCIVLTTDMEQTKPAPTVSQ